MTYRSLLIKRELVAAPLDHAVLPSRSWRALRTLLNDLTAEIQEYQSMGTVCHATCPIHGHWCETSRDDHHIEHVSSLCACRWDDFGDVVSAPPVAQHGTFVYGRMITTVKAPLLEE